MALHVIVSGGSSGIGLAIARKLAGNGWNVTILARDKTRLEEARLAILESCRSSAEGTAEQVDVRDEAAVGAAVQAAIARHGAPDLVVASAGIVIPKRFTELSSAD